MLRAEHAKRCTQMIATIQRHMPPGSIRFARPAGGLYLWCRLGAGLSATALHERALGGRRHVRARPGVLSRSRRGFRSCACASPACCRATIEESIKRLARCVGEVRLTA